MLCHYIVASAVARRTSTELPHHVLTHSPLSETLLLDEISRLNNAATTKRLRYSWRRGPTASLHHACRDRMPYRSDFYAGSRRRPPSHNTHRPYGLWKARCQGISRDNNSILYYAAVYVVWLSRLHTCQLIHDDLPRLPHRGRLWDNYSALCCYRNIRRAIITPNLRPANTNAIRIHFTSPHVPGRHLWIESNNSDHDVSTWWRTIRSRTDT